MKIKSTNRCGAKTRSGAPCRKWAMANGRCKLHGGKSPGAKKGNKYNLRTGEYETILVETLTDDEKGLFDSATTEKLKAIDEELKLITFREHRMLKIIAGYHEQLGELLVVSEEEEQESDGDILRVSKKKTKRESVESSIVRSEEALTRVQAQKARLIELKHKIEDQEVDEEDWTTKLRQMAEVMGAAQTGQGTDTADHGEEKD